jgi:hypothetical protein
MLFLMFDLGLLCQKVFFIGDNYSLMIVYYAHSLVVCCASLLEKKNCG